MKKSPFSHTKKKGEHWKNREKGGLRNTNELNELDFPMCSQISSLARSWKNLDNLQNLTKSGSSEN